MHSATPLLPVLLAWAMTLPASAVEGVCGLTNELDFSNSWIPPFGGEYLGVVTTNFEIVNTQIEVQFTATGAFNAADIGVVLEFIDSGSHSAGFTGQQLGWSGQGTFRALFDTSSMNGTIYNGGQWGGMNLYFSNLNVGNGPITGNFDVLVFRITLGDCPLGDVNHDVNVDVDDLLIVISNWGDCPPQPETCDADTNGDGEVEINDLLNVITHWAQWCPKCS